MSSLFDIQQKLEMIYFKYIFNEEYNIISDEGLYNVPLENNNNIRYIFNDTKDYGNRSIDEQNKLLFLNETMDLLDDLRDFIYITDPLNKPINLHALLNSDLLFLSPLLAALYNSCILAIKPGVFKSSNKVSEIFKIFVSLVSS